MRFRKIIKSALNVLVLCFGALAMSSASVSAEIPIGQYTGIGFSVEKNGAVVFSDKNLHSHSAALSIVQNGEQSYEWTLSVEVTKSANSAPVKVTKIDRFLVNLIGESSGELINQNPEYKNDRSIYEVTQGKLTVRSWISRHEAWETHTYVKR